MQTVLDPDQTPRSAASDQGLRCLPMPHLWDARQTWVETRTEIVIQEQWFKRVIYKTVFQCI